MAGRIPVTAGRLGARLDCDAQSRATVFAGSPASPHLCRKVVHCLSVSLALLATPPPASGPNWWVFALTQVASFLVGSATALLVQFYIVPDAETRKRKAQ